MNAGLDRATERSLEVRGLRKRFRSELRSLRLARRQAAALLADAIAEAPDWLWTVDVDELLGWCPGIATETIDDWLEQIDATGKRPLIADRADRPGLTARQRRALVGLLRERAGIGDTGDGGE